MEGYFLLQYYLRMGDTSPVFFDYPNKKTY